MENLKTITKGAGISFIGIIISYILAYLFNIIIARAIGASGVGLFNLGQSIIILLSPIAIFGLDTGILRYLPMHQKDNAVVRGIMSFSLKLVASVSVILALLLIFFSKHIADKVFHTSELSLIIKLFALCLPLMTIMTIFRQIALAYKKPVYKVLIEDIIQKVLLISFSLLFIYLGFNVLGIVYTFIISILISASIYLIFIKKTTPLFSFKIKPEYISKELLVYSFPLLFAGIVAIIIAKMDILMLGYFRTPAEVGIYSIAIKTALLLLIGLQAVNQIFSPMISSLHQKGEIQELSSLYKTTTKWIFSIAYPGLLIILLFSKNILGLFGKDFIIGSSALILLGISQLINSSTGSSGYIIAMIGKSKILLLNQIMIFSVNFFLNLLLIPKFGIIGAAIATAFAIAAVNFLQLGEVYYFLKIHPYKLTFLKPLIIGLISFVIVKYIPLHWLINLIIFSALYLSLILLFGLEKEEKILLKLTINKFIPKSIYTFK